MTRRTRKLFAAKSAPKAASCPNVPHDEIAREAFKIYQARHGAPGDPVADWFEATRIVTTRTTRAPKEASAEASAGNSRAGNRARTAARRRSRK